jgi:hypothetical protein
MNPNKGTKTARLQFLLACLILTIPLGYWLRFRAPIDAAWRDRTGGALYVLVWVELIALLRPQGSVTRMVIAVLAVTCALEFLQLWHPAPLEAARATLPGRLLLGTTFDWSDFPSYFAGALLAWPIVRFANQLR